MTLAGDYHLRVIADLMTIPPWLADCPAWTPASDAARCATGDLPAYAAVIGQIVAHADPAIRDWELWNEPDSGQFFHGTPAQYAWMLRTAHDEIKQVDPHAQVLLGGISGTAGSTWLAQVLAAPGADALHAFDVANVHERGWLDGLAGDIRAWRAMFAGVGFTGPLWVTEHGYPSDPAFQYDPGYASGAASQADYLAASLPTLLDAGASEVLVTERDNLGGQFASEGVLGGDVADPPVSDPAPVERPAFDAVQAITACYGAWGRDCASAAPLSTPATLTLPPARLGSASQATVIVSDPGPQPAALGAVGLAAPAAFRAVGLATPAADQLTLEPSSCSGLILEPDERCSVTVRFTPAGAGSLAATLQLPSDQGSLAVPVRATSPSVASLRASAPVRSRGEADGVGHPQQLTVTVFNPLTGPVHVASAQISGQDFSIAVDSCARSIDSPRGDLRGQGSLAAAVAGQGTGHRDPPRQRDPAGGGAAADGVRVAGRDRAPAGPRGRLPGASWRRRRGDRRRTGRTLLDATASAARGRSALPPGAGAELWGEAGADLCGGPGAPSLEAVAARPARPAGTGDVPPAALRSQLARPRCQPHVVADGRVTSIAWMRSTTSTSSCPTRSAA